MALAYMTNWFIDADGTGTDLGQFKVGEFLDNNGMTYILTDLVVDPESETGFVSLDFNFSNVGFLTLPGIDGVIPAPWYAKGYEVTGIYSLTGSGTLGKSISFDTGTLAFYSHAPFNYGSSDGYYGANDGTLIGEFALSYGYSELSDDLTGAPNGFVTLNFYSTYLESGYWFDSLGNDLSELSNINWLLGYSTTNLSYVADPTQVSVTEFQEYLTSLGLAYNGNTQPMAWIGSANGQIRADIVPEPSTVFLLGVGLLGLGFVSRRKNN